MNYYRFVAVLAAALVPLSHAQPGYDVLIPAKAPAGPSEAEVQAKKEAAAQAARANELERKLAAAEKARREAEEKSKRAADTAERAENQRKADEAKRLADQEAADQRAADAAAKAERERSARALARHPQTNQPLNAKDIISEPYGPRMVVMPLPASGSFTMGSPSNETGHQNDEKQHTVRLGKPYALAETETTFAQWDACVSDGGCNADGDKAEVTADFGRGQHPVINVTHSQARQYAAWVSKKLKLNPPYHYRLPSEAEWEWAARAGNAGPFGFERNQNISPTLARYDWRQSYAGSPTQTWEPGTMPVSSYPPSAFGLHDMAGNVKEWVADCYESDYSKVPDNGTAYREDDNTCSSRLLRGGSWYFTPKFVRAADRFSGTPTARSNFIGFRLARLLPSGN